MTARILVVEDEQEHARTITDAIAGCGFEVVITPNGREGLRVLHDILIDGILLDLEMPVMNGWTMLDELRWQGSDVPVIVMSQEGNQAKLRKLLEEGAQDYVVKPLTHHILRQKSLRHFSQRAGAGRTPVREELLTRIPGGLQGAFISQRAFSSHQQCGN